MLTNLNYNSSKINLVDNVVLFSDYKKGSDKEKYNNSAYDNMYDSTEVYAFKTEEEIKAIFRVLEEKIQNGNGNKKLIAMRNKLLFKIGINIGIRASDLCRLKWKDFISDIKNDIQFNESFTIKPKKTRKYNKYVKLYINNDIKEAIIEFLEYYKVEDLNDYIFKSRKGNNSITVRSMWKIIKGIALEAGIKQNIGSHSLRKTWGYWCWNKSKNKTETLVLLQKCFNHSSTSTTIQYIGLMDKDISNVYNSLNYSY